MDEEALTALAEDLETEDLTGADERPLAAADIQPVLEALAGRGVDLSLAAEMA
jgi:hypothetical protein